MANSLNGNSEMYVDRGLSAVRYVKSPKTGKPIKVGGPTYQKLAKSERYNGFLKNAKKVGNPKRGSSKKNNPGKRVYPSGKAPKGCSTLRAGKYPNVPADEFCGPEGGACPGSYPVNTRGRARAALAYARHAPDPEGIKRCVRRKASQKGWMDSDRKLKM